MTPSVVLSFVLMAALVLAPSTARAQQTSGIAGVVRDASGAVLPGVTVEAASPALIEKVRSVVSDNEGQYKIVDLRPGTYSVTFTLTGFNTYRREGIELTSGFTATVNAEMKIGGVEETITVTGESPLVDTQNVLKQVVVSDALIDALPTSLSGVQNLVNLTPGMSGYAYLTGEYQSNVGNGFHGQAANQAKQQFDGMQIDNMAGSGALAYMANSDAVQEMTLQTNGITAESSASGILTNMIPKEGANIFSGTAAGLFTDDRLQGDNLSDELRSRGVRSVNKIEHIRQFGATLGGPIRKDKLWFFTAHQWWNISNLSADVYWNRTQGTPLYTPDFSRPANRYETFRSNLVRMTWQATTTSKFAFFADNQDYCICRRSALTLAPEAGGSWRFYPQGLYQATWTAPLTNRLLITAGVGATISHWPAFYQDGVTRNDISILELSTSFRYNAAPAYSVPQDSDRYSQRFAVSYVTGSHAFKTGVDVGEGINNTGLDVNGNVTYNFLRGVPASLTQFATPYITRVRLNPDLGIYAQDQWTIRRLTLNLGLRFEYLNAYVPAQEVPATPNGWIPARSFEQVNCVPCWKDLSPRMGAAYDMFGNGRTALKFSIGRYVGKTAGNIASANNPITTSVNSVTRTWTDGNVDYIPDCNLANRSANGECGAVSDPNFGGLRITTRYDDDVLRGWGVRDYNWDMSTEVNHQLTSRISTTFGYYRSWYGNFTVTDNLSVEPSDFDPFCVTAPTDARLPNGGGYQVCGLYDISPARFGRVNNLVTSASRYGDQKRINNYFTGTFNTRLGRGVQLGGGVDFGQTLTDTCFVVDSPQQLVNCRTVVPFKGTSQVKIYGSYPLPGEFVVSAVFQNVAPPQYTADYAATNAEIAPSLGRNLAACGTQNPCTATTASGSGGGATIVGGVAGLIPLIRPQTQFEGRRTAFDVRLTKHLQVTRKVRLQVNVDAYNILNLSPILNVVNTYGPIWRQPISFQGGPGVQDARLIQFSGRLAF